MRPTIVPGPMEKDITVSVPMTQRQWIEHTAGALNLPISEVIRMCITRGMAARPVTKDDELNQRIAEFLDNYTIFGGF